MAVKLRRPILVGGVGLSFSLWMLQSLHHSLGQVGEFGVIGAIALGGALLLARQGKAKNIEISPSKPLEREIVEKEIALANTAVTQLAVETENHPSFCKDAINHVSTMRERVGRLRAELDRKEICVAVTGGKSAGKTTLMQQLQLSALAIEKLPGTSLKFRETPALFVGTDGDESAEKTAIEMAIASDLVLFVAAGDITAPEFKTLQQLEAAKQKTVLVFNKQDQYLPEERATILEQLRYRMPDAVAIAASPSPLKVRQHQADGSCQEWMEQPNPEIAQLTGKLSEILAQESQQLVWATTIRAAGAVKAEAKTLLNQVRRDRALPQIEQYQWIAAAAAFANPVPALDLLATGAINAQLVMELSAIYQQKFSLEQAKAVAGTMGSLMLKLGLVELSTQTISGILKTNAITFVAGGLLQGVSAAYLTRLAGLSLIEYLQEQDVVLAEGRPLNLHRLGETLQKVFQQNQRVAVLQSFVGQTMARILPESSQPQLTPSETVVSC